MSDDDLTFDQVVELSRRNKRELVADWRPGMPDAAVDLVNHAVVVRDGRNMALVYQGPSGPLGGRRAAYLAAALFRADEVYMIADTIGSKVAVKPEDLDAIKPGSMVEAWERGERKALTEGLMMQRFDRTGLLEIRLYPYVRMGATITWHEPRVMEHEVERLSGAIAEHVAEGFDEGKRLFDIIEPLAVKAAIAMGLPVEERQMHIDRACAMRASESDGGIVVILEPVVTKFEAGKEVAFT
jgi:hypothetical protein